MEEEKFSPLHQFYDPGFHPRRKRSKKFQFFFIIIVLATLSGILWAVVFPSPKKEIVKENTTPSISLQPSPTSIVTTPTPEISQKQTPRSKIKIEVLNGSGVSGAGKKVASYLESLGYIIVKTGNADSFDYETTVIEISKSKEEILDQLKKDLSEYTIDPQTPPLSSNELDVRIIVGKE